MNEERCSQMGCLNHQAIGRPNIHLLLETLVSTTIQWGPKVGGLKLLDPIV